MAIQNIKIRRTDAGPTISTAVEYGYSEVLIRKGPDGIDSTITLSVNDAQQLVEDLQAQVALLVNGR